MTFLAPLFLLGALAIAGPVLFHLIRRNTKEKFTFSSLMFLRPDLPRVTRKSRLEAILLLIVRCALLAVMALAFARPFFRQSNHPPMIPAPVNGSSYSLIPAPACAEMACGIVPFQKHTLK